MDIDDSADADTSITGGSAYAQKRSEKLCYRQGGEDQHLPRYLTLQPTPIEARGSGSQTVAAVAAGAPVAAVVAPPISANGKKTKGKSNVEASTAVEDKPYAVDVDSGVPSAVGAEALPTSSVNSDVQLDCSTGSCFLQRKDPATVISTTTFTADGGKIQSGPGVTYAPFTAASKDAGAMSGAKPLVPPKKIMKLVGQAIKEWNMIEDGDRLLLGLSGGKDSLALLHILLALQVTSVCLTQASFKKKKECHFIITHYSNYLYHAMI
jgi:hypothetical protein